MELNDITYKIRGAIFNVYNELGPGLFESVYEEALLIELRRKGLKTKNQTPVKVDYKGEKLDVGFRLDILVEDRVLVELKSTEKLQRIHSKQLQTYLKLTGKKLGLLVNFNCTDLKDNIIRIINY